MKVYHLIEQLNELVKFGYGEDEVRIIAGCDCPTCGEGEAIQGVFVIDNYPDRNIDGVYIKGNGGEQN